MKTLVSIGIGLMVLTSLLAFAAVRPAHAAGTVSTCNEASLLAALSGGGTVTFACSGTITLSATITISADTTIDASGRDVTISGVTPNQVFAVNSGRSLTLRNLTISGGNNTTGNGGGLANNGGTVTIVNSAFRNNTASGNGGGIYNAAPGTVNVVNSTFASNTAVSGGGIYNAGGTVSLANATISSNSATTATGSGGGVNNGSGTVNVKNTIIAGNLTSGGAANPDVRGTFTSQGYNLVGDYTGSTGFSPPPPATNWDLPAGPAGLGALTGSPAYFPLNAGSAAINAGNPAGCTDHTGAALTTDQRGTAATRPRSGRCDIGAFELQSNAAPVANPTTITLNEDDARAGTLTASDSDPNTIFTYSLVSNGSKGTATITNARTGDFTYVPNANENGVDFFTFKVNDTEVDSASATVTVNITPVNDQPTLNPIGNLTVSQGSLTQSITLTGITSGASNENQTLRFTGSGCTGPSSSDPSVVPTPTITYASPLSTATLSFTPGNVGASTITVTLCDSGGTADGGVDKITRTFVITVAVATSTFTPSNTWTPSATPTQSPTASPAPTTTPTFTPTTVPSATVPPTTSVPPPPPTQPPTATPDVPLTQTLESAQTQAAVSALTQTAAAAPTLTPSPSPTPNLTQTQASAAATSRALTPTSVFAAVSGVVPATVPPDTVSISVSQPVEASVNTTMTCGIWVFLVPPGTAPAGSAFSCATVSSQEESRASVPFRHRPLWRIVDVGLSIAGGPAGADFQQPVIACAYYTEKYLEAAGNDPNRLIIYAAKNQRDWSALPTVADPTLPRVCTTLRHLGRFRLLAQPAPLLGGRLGPATVVTGLAVLAGLLVLGALIALVVIVLRRRRNEKAASAQAEGT